MISAASWRGYVAIFEITDNQLYIEDIQIKIENNDDYEWKSVINAIFPHLSERKLISVFGALTLSFGEIINYVHLGYGSIYEN